MTAQQNGVEEQRREGESQDSSLYGPQDAKERRLAGLTMAGKGRTKGNPNRLTKTMKQAIEAAFEQAGGVEYLVKLAHGTASDRQAFVALVGRLLPLQINSDIDHKIRVELPWLVQRGIGKVQASDTESFAQVGKSLTHQDVSDGDVVEGSSRRLMGDSAGVQGADHD